MNRKGGLIIFGVLCLIVGTILLILHFTKKCPKGKYKTILGCTTCKEGNYCLDNKSNECPAGKSSKAGSSSVTECENCPKGTSSKAGSKCNPCAVGTYSDKIGQAYCKACQAGYYQDQAGQTKCKICLAGSYSHAGASKCTSCEKGNYQPDQGKSECIPCVSGTYQDQTGQVGCQTCPSTSPSSQPGTTKEDGCTASKCSAGAFFNKKKDKCEDCIAGSYSQAGASKCTSCELGKYQPESGQSVCSFCKGGYTTNKTGTISETGCTECHSGTHSSQVSGKQQCTTCSAGSYSSSGAEKCSQCAAGTYSSSGAEKCSQCAAGSYSQASASKCTSCELGKYQPDPGKSECIPCAAGTYQDQTEQTKCKICPGNKTTTSTGSTSSEDCKGCNSPSIYSAGKCVCPAGYGKGKNNCTLCPPGMYSDSDTAWDESCQYLPIGAIGRGSKYPDVSTCSGWTCANIGQFCKDGGDEYICLDKPYKSCTGTSGCWHPVDACNNVTFSTGATGYLMGCCETSTGDCYDPHGNPKVTGCNHGYKCGGAPITVNGVKHPLSNWATCPVGMYCLTIDDLPEDAKAANKLKCKSGYCEPDPDASCTDRHDCTGAGSICVDKKCVSSDKQKCTSNDDCNRVIKSQLNFGDDCSDYTDVDYSCKNISKGFGWCHCNLAGNNCSCQSS